MNNQMKIVCAWCGKVIRDGTEPSSDGMCGDCRKKFDKEVDEFIKQKQKKDKKK